MFCQFHAFEVFEYSEKHQRMLELCFIKSFSQQHHFKNIFKRTKISFNKPFSETLRLINNIQASKT